MFQPEVKLEFVRRYCNPDDGWIVRVDIDASEEGRTGGMRKSPESKAVQTAMKQDGLKSKKALVRLGVTIGGPKNHWLSANDLPDVPGDRDVLAFHKKSKTMLICEVEGASTGQPEQKLYKAAGQIVSAASVKPPDGYSRDLVIAVHGEKIAGKLKSLARLAELGISAIAVERRAADDHLCFGNASALKRIRRS